ncbi:MAG: hypothetical protein NTW25_12440 [Candidatus Kapabacteria bacterium]|nr:hypothetical protein [Candidatus Kapabacteria bacterium]
MGYQGFSVTGRCGAIDFSKSTIIEKKIISNGPIVQLYKGLYIGLENWDGSDFIIPDGSTFLIITSKVYKVMKKNKISNIEFENLSNFEVSKSVIHRV